MAISFPRVLFLSMPRCVGLFVKLIMWEADVIVLHYSTKRIISPSRVAYPERQKARLRISLNRLLH